MSSNPVLLFQDSFGYSGPLHFLMNFRMSLSIFPNKHCNSYCDCYELLICFSISIFIPVNLLIHECGNSLCRPYFISTVLYDFQCLIFVLLKFSLGILFFEVILSELLSFILDFYCEYVQMKFIFVYSF